MDVEDQLRAAITRQAHRYEVPMPDIDGFAARASRRRRQRAVAAATACAVLGIVASGFVAGRSLLDGRGAGPAHQPPTPTQQSTTSPTDERVGIIGPPPPGTPPTGPATGELVAAATTWNTGSWVYADGRLVNVVRNYVSSDEFRGFVVRQLTPSGVEAIRSLLLDATKPGSLPHGRPGEVVVREGGRLVTLRPFAACGQPSDEISPDLLRVLPKGTTLACPALEHPETWLPANAWEDSTYRPFIPVTFQVCLSPSTDAAALLPTPAADIFLASPSHQGDGAGTDCRDVATSDARTMADELEEAGAVTDNGSTVALSLHPEKRGGDDDYGVEFLPILPHGGTFCDCG